jgi:hypothetical protein
MRRLSRLITGALKGDIGIGMRTAIPTVRPSISRLPAPLPQKSGTIIIASDYFIRANRRTGGVDWTGTACTGAPCGSEWKLVFG